MKIKQRTPIKMKDKIEPVEEHSSEPIEHPPWVVPLSISMVTFFFYLPILYNGFVNWDDPTAILENYHIHSLNFSSLRWMFTSFHTGNWIPLTWLSLTLDYVIGGPNPKIYHLHNLLLHLINTVLVFFLSFKILNLAAKTNTPISKISLWNGKKWMGKITPAVFAASLAALLFGLHPIHVESVAWATERKDLLFSLFFFASLLIYLDNVSSDSEKLWKWIACWGFFALSLLSKSMAVTLPLVFLLLDIWPLNRFHTKGSKLLFEKIPFFLLAFIIAVITIFAQAQAGAISEMAKLPLDFRIMNAFHSLIFYIWKMMLPIDLVPFYPIGHQGNEAFSSSNLMGAFFVTLISLACYYYWKAKPYLAIAWLYYIITLAPVLGIVQVGTQAAADRYTYLPCLSLFILFSASVVSFLSRRTVLTAFSTVLVALLGFATVKQLAIWKDSISLWEGVAKAYPDMSIVIHANLGNAYKQFGQKDKTLLNKALREYNRALALRQPHAFIYDGKGIVLLNQGKVDEAIETFQLAIALDPNYASPHRNLWFAYEKKGLHELALAEILKAVSIEPEFAEAYNNLGISYGRQAEFEKSIEAFKMAFSIDPHSSKYLINLATTYQRKGEFDQAIGWYKKGLQLNTNEPIYYLNLANTFLLKGMVIEAIETLKVGMQIQPPNADIFQKLGIIYEKVGQAELAMQYYEKAMHLSGQK